MEGGVGGEKCVCSCMCGGKSGGINYRGGLSISRIPNGTPDGGPTGLYLWYGEGIEHKGPCMQLHRTATGAI